jgi:hypothetical protein
MDMTSVIVYPYIVPDLAWLKVAALLWDKVHRISSEFSPGDPVEVQELIARIPDFLVSEEVTGNLGSAARSVFEEWLKTHHKGLSDSADWMTVYPDKFVDASVELLCRYRLIRDADRPQWHEVTPEHLIRSAKSYRLPKAVAVHYLSVIASILAERNSLDLFAEERGSAQTSISSRYNVGTVATTTLEAYLPKELTLPKIVELRESFGQERLNYQTAIASVVDEMEKLSSVGELNQVAKRAEDLAKMRIEQTKKKYDQAKVGSIVKTLGVSLAPPGLATCVASLLGLAVWAPAAIGAAICLVGAEFLSTRDKAKAERDTSNWAYVFRVAGS